MICPNPLLPLHITDDDDVWGRLGDNANTEQHQSRRIHNIPFLTPPSTATMIFARYAVTTLALCATTTTTAFVAPKNAAVALSGPPPLMMTSTLSKVSVSSFFARKMNVV